MIALTEAAIAASRPKSRPGFHRDGTPVKKRCVIPGVPLLSQREHAIISCPKTAAAERKADLIISRKLAEIRAGWDEAEHRRRAGKPVDPIPWAVPIISTDEVGPVYEEDEPDRLP